MPEELVPEVRTKEIRPEGAVEDAAAFRRAAQRCREYGDRLRGFQSNLDQVWAGRSKERYFHDHGFEATPVDMDLLAEWLEDQARQIDGKRVTIEYIVLVPRRPTWR
jgi:hypothetical protein